MFRISCSDDAASRVVLLEGWLDAGALPALDEAAAQASGRKLVLDLAAVRWIDGPSAERIAALRKDRKSVV